jgi:hypothetical protein
MKLTVKGRDVAVLTRHNEDCICITDIARHKNAEHTDDLIRNWLRNRNTIEFLGIWEQLNNPGFNPVEFDGFKRQAGLNSFTLTPASGLSKPAPSASSPSPAATAAPTPTKTSRPGILTLPRSLNALYHLEQL